MLPDKIKLVPAPDHGLCHGCYAFETGVNCPENNRTEDDSPFLRCHSGVWVAADNDDSDAEVRQ